MGSAIGALLSEPSDPDRERILARALQSAPPLSNATVIPLASRRRFSLTGQRWLSAAAAVLILIGTTLVLMRSGANDEDDNADSAAISAPSERAAADQDGAGESFAQEIASVVEGGDLGMLDESTDLQRTLEEAGALDRFDTSAGGDEGSAAGRESSETTSPAGEEESANPADPSATSGDCLPILTELDPTLGALRYRASGTWAGGAALVFGFEVPEGGALGFRAYIVTASDCRVLNVQFFAMP